MMVGHELYSMFARGVRAVYPQDDDSDPEDPDADTASLIMALGPLIREVCNPRGVADPDGKLAKLEAIIEEQMPAREGRTATQARAVLTVLQARDVAVPDAFRERILAMTDVEQLERWLRRAAVATSIRDVLDDRG
ncbi:MAG TPA: hypothetical protein VN253_21040 [Kofleriaceae bacterium]|nr:hypothetical protein [Kofleriaceae bacterium]